MTNLIVGSGKRKLSLLHPRAHHQSKSHSVLKASYSWLPINLKQKVADCFQFSRPWSLSVEYCATRSEYGPYRQNVQMLSLPRLAQSHNFDSQS